MQKLIAFLFALLLALPYIGAQAEEENIIRRAVPYPGENFSIAIPAQYLAFYKEELGLTISAGIDKTTFYARVKVMPDDPVSFSEEDYFENIWLPNQRSIYIGKNYNMVLDEGKTQTYTVCGREMIGHPFLLKIAGKENCDLMLFDRWDGKIIRYELYYLQNDPDAALQLLGNMVRSVTKHALAPKETKQTVSPIVCQEQSFSFSAKPSYPWEFDRNNGVTVYTEEKGRIPYIMVYQSNNLIVEDYEYLKEQYTPHMKEVYGDDLISYSEYENFAIGGRFVPLGRYSYRVKDQSVTMLRVIDSSGKRTVVYTAKYLTDRGADTLAALDAAVASFQSSVK